MTVTLEAHSDGDTDSAIVNHIDNGSVRKTSVNETPTVRGLAANNNNKVY